jgi:transposase InsO family protein
VNSCPGCGVQLGRFAAHTDHAEHDQALVCSRTGVKHALPQDIPKRPPSAGSKANKRRKSRRPIVIAERRAERRRVAAAKDRRDSKQSLMRAKT